MARDGAASRCQAGALSGVSDKPGTSATALGLPALRPRPRSQALSDAVTVFRVDHFAIGSTDTRRTCEFFERVLGGELTAQPRGLWAIRIGELTITIHGPGAEPSPPGVVPPGVSHICLRWEGSIESAHKHLETCGVPIEAGPVGRHGAGGEGASIYFRDPDGSLLELISYSGAPPGRPQNTQPPTVS